MTNPPPGWLLGATPYAVQAEAFRRPATRAEAKAIGSTQYLTGKPCPHGHTAARITSSAACSACLHARQRANRPKENRRRRVARRASADSRRKDNARRSRLQRVQVQLRHRVSRAVQGNFKAGSAIRDLGCSIPEFREYVAAKFVDGMTWINYGEWHLDHILPLASFDLSDRDQFLEACHFSNYQPLWAADNISKGARVA